MLVVSDFPLVLTEKLMELVKICPILRLIARRLQKRKEEG